MLLDAASGNSEALDSRTDDFMSRLCKVKTAVKTDAQGNQLLNDEGKPVMVVLDSRMPGFDRYGSCGSSTVTVNKENGDVSFVVGRFRKGLEDFSVVGRYAPAGSGAISVVIFGNVKDETRAVLDKFLMEEDMFRGMSRGIVKLDAVSELSKKKTALAEAKGALKQAKKELFEAAGTADFKRKQAVETENTIFAVSSGVLDYSGNTGQFNEQPAGVVFRRGHNRSFGKGNGSRSSVVVYRFYIPSDCKEDSTELYPLLDGIEERDLGILSRRAGSMDKVMEGFGFDKTGGVSVTERNGDTEGRLGRYQRDGASVTVRAVTENKAGTGYYEVVAYGISSSDESLVSLARHSEMFSGLDIYDGSASLKSSCLLGRNDGSLGIDASTGVADGRNVGKQGEPEVDLSDVGKNKGKGVSFV